jgi:hypothetical protein
MGEPKGNIAGFLGPLTEVIVWSLNVLDPPTATVLAALIALVAALSAALLNSRRAERQDAISRRREL